MAELALTANVNYDKRKGYGQAGQKIPLRVNAFPVVKFPEGYIFQYDVAVVGDDKLPARVKRQIWQQLEKAAALQGHRVVYDGSKIAFSLKELGSEKIEVDVALPEDRPSKAAQGREERKFKVVLRKAARINAVELAQFVAGRMQHTADALMTITALNVMLRHQPSLTNEAKRESIFQPPTDQSPPFPIIGGLEMWRGFWTSIRPTHERLIVNIDSVAMPFIRPGNLAEVAANLISAAPPGRPVRPDILARAPPRDHIRLARMLKGLRCEAIFTDPKEPGGKKGFKVKEYSQKAARLHEFSLEDGSKTTIERWWKSAKNVTLKFPNLGCVRVTKTAWYPLELLNVLYGSKYSGKLSPDQVADILKFTTHKPQEKMGLIRQGLAQLGYANSEMARSWGFEMSTNMLEAEGRVLPPPQIAVGKNRKLNVQNGVFDMRGAQFLKPASIQPHWGVIVFDTPTGSGARFSGLPLQDAENIVGALCRALGQSGISIANPKPPIIHVGEQRPVRDAFVELRQRLQNNIPQIVLILLPRKGMPKYAEVKAFGDVTVGVVTQCMDISKARKLQPAYFGNVALKVNMKLGGVNNNLTQPIPASAAASKEPCITFGADVAHPGPGSFEPSVAGIVATNSPSGDGYNTETRAQLSRLEIINDLENMVYSLIKRYYAKSKVQPKRIIYYRDGVSEGQFARVCVDEVKLIKAACARLDPSYRPLLTFIVCGKRHHIRFVPAAGKDAQDNAPAGTVLDKQVISPFYNDCYILSHRGMLGTSRPTHYSILLDESNFSADDLQQTIYNSTYMFQRATRAVSIASPAYFAHLVCTRGRDHINAQSREDSESVLSPSVGSNEMDNEKSNRLATVQSLLKPVHEKQLGLSYFL